MSKRSIGIFLLLFLIGFYAFGTGFDFFYRFFYALILLLALGFVWAWMGLRGIEIQLIRTATRGRVGENMQGSIRLTNRIKLPKSWLEVVEKTDLPTPPSGRGGAMVGDQVRTWRTETPLTRRGVYHTGEIEVTSQDPFALFRLHRQFLQSQSFTVLPAVLPLPDLDPLLASLPSDGRDTRHWDNITTDVASIRPYADGDSYRRIHWPYTARMNSLMVKEFDMGLSAESWIILDLQAAVHVDRGAGSDRAGRDGAVTLENTEELAVTVAASLISRFTEFSLPVGLAVSGRPSIIYRPNTSPEHPAKLMESLSVVRATGDLDLDLERFLHDLRPYFSRFNTLTIVTPSTETAWVPTLSNLRRRGISLSVILIDPEGFQDAPGSRDAQRSGAQHFKEAAGVEPVLRSLSANEVPGYVVRKGQSLNVALSSALTGRPQMRYTRAYVPAVESVG